MVPLLEELRIEAAKGKLSRLVITKDYRFVLADSNIEVELQPVHKAVYLLFLAHPEGIEFKQLANYREELTHYYMSTAKLMDEYSASYYIISSHTQKHIEGSSRIWYQRLKVITLPRVLVVMEK